MKSNATRYIIPILIGSLQEGHSEEKQLASLRDLGSTPSKNHGSISSFLSASKKLQTSNGALLAASIRSGFQPSILSFVPSIISVSPVFGLIRSSACDIEILSDGLNLIKPSIIGSKGFKLSSWTLSSNLPFSFEGKDWLFP